MLCRLCPVSFRENPPPLPPPPASSTLGSNEARQSTVGPRLYPGILELYDTTQHNHHHHHHPHPPESKQRGPLSKWAAIVNCLLSLNMIPACFSGILTVIMLLPPSPHRHGFCLFHFCSALPGFVGFGHKPCLGTIVSVSLSLYMIRQFISFVSQPLWFSPRLQYTVHPTEYYPFLPRGTKSLDGPGDPLPINLEPVDGGPPRYPRCITRQGRGVVSISSELAMA